VDKGDWFDACLGWTQDQWFGYAEGYKRAADLITQHILHTERDQDFLIFPIVFLYRQAIEIALKHLIYTGKQLTNLSPGVPAHHRLTALWEIGRPIIEKVWPDGPKQDLKAVTDVLQQFEFKDPTSTLFRYPITKDGNASFLRNERMNISNYSGIPLDHRINTSVNGIRKYCFWGRTDRRQMRAAMLREP